MEEPAGKLILKVPLFINTIHDIAEDLNHQSIEEIKGKDLYSQYDGKRNDGGG